LCLADFNGDGWLDLVVSQAEADRCFLFWGGPDGFSADHRRMLPVMRGSAPTACDLTGSGRLDLIIGGHKPSLEGPHDSFVYIYWNGPEGLREDRRTQLPANAVLALAIADFNRDGWFDLFAGSYTTGRDRDIDSHVYWGGPHGFRRGDRTRLRTHSVSGCLAADFNEDGWIDLAICNHKTFGDHRGDSFVLWNGPGGLDPSRCTRLPTTGSHGMIFFQPGNQADRGPEEHYVSEPFEMPPGARPRSIEWTAGLPPKTWVRAHLRSAATREGLAAAPWFGPQGPCPVRRQGPSALGLGQMPRERDAFENRGSLSAVDLAGPWIQYRLALGAVNGGCTPRVTRVRVVFG
jgi:hypothetical protein